jgi:flagellar basal-body rod protein FlgG
MSVQTLYTAATGMEALETKLDVIANNLANVNTLGFKKDRANFEDLLYRNEVLPGAEVNGNPTATGTKVGLGTKVSSVQTDFRQGAFQLTGKATDLGIEGPGFFSVENTDGSTAYTRSGNFSINANGEMVLGSAQAGRKLADGITIPATATGIVVQSSGEVFYQESGGTGGLQSAGTISLTSFVNPEGLLKLGENLFQETPASGTANSNTAGTNGVGVIRQNALEASNVEPVQELIDLITTQRSFELNSQAVQAGDQLLQLVSNLRRF